YTIAVVSAYQQLRNCLLGIIILKEPGNDTPCSTLSDLSDPKNDFHDLFCLRSICWEYADPKSL
ncbi:MAG: hypothetical protein ACOC4M_13355, partial [Promethearchaeia archaeon]